MERDSIVFYKDWWEAISSLPEDKQPEAIRAVMDYAFKGMEPEDTMLRFATAQIRMFIDRDRKRYEAICEKRREYARRGGLAKAAKSKQLETNGKNNNQKQAKAAYNENGNENEHEQSNINIPLQSVNKRVREGQTDSASLKEQIAECKASSIWKDGIRMKFHLKDYAEVDALLDDFAVDMVCKEIEVRNAKKYFLTWMSDRQQENRDPSRNREPGLGIGEYRDSKGRRRYAKSDVVVPDSAPPRPSAAHWWSDASGMWVTMI